MRNFKLVLCYDGTRYNGWQKQGNTENTVQGRMESLLSRLLKQQIELNGSGRTDAGVHAREQVCSFRAETELPVEEILAEIRRYLPEDIGAVSLEDAPPRFHARLNCIEKTYVYTLHYGNTPDVFLRRYHSNIPGSYDTGAMREAASLLCGKHDFTAFTSNRHMKKSAVRDLRNIEIEDDAAHENLVLTFTGDGFLYNMVRILTGTLLEVGLGKKQPSEMAGILASCSRAEAGFTAPAQGLVLWSEKY